MTIEDIRAAYYLKPFQPFVVRLSDGRKFIIPQRNYISLSPTGEFVIILHDDDEAFTRVPMSMIASLEQVKRKRQRKQSA